MSGSQAVLADVLQTQDGACVTLAPVSGQLFFPSNNRTLEQFLPVPGLPLDQSCVRYPLVCRCQDSVSPERLVPVPSVVNW